MNVYIVLLFVRELWTVNVRISFFLINKVKYAHKFAKIMRVSCCHECS